MHYLILKTVRHHSDRQSASRLRSHRMGVGEGVVSGYLPHEGRADCRINNTRNRAASVAGENWRRIEVGTVPKRAGSVMIRLECREASTFPKTKGSVMKERKKSTV